MTEPMRDALQAERDAWRERAQKAENAFLRHQERLDAQELRIIAAESRLASARVAGAREALTRFAAYERERGAAVFAAFADDFRDREYPAPAAPAGEQTRPAPTPEPEPQNVAWSDAGYRREVLSDATGRILGSVVQGRHEATAYGEHGVIGQYISLNLAKKAVVVALGSRPTQTAEG